MSTEDFRKRINEKFKVEVILPADRGITKMPRLSTGILALDIDSGGGWSAGRVIEIYGPESSGKSFVLQKTIAGITNRTANNKCLLVDEEGSFEEDWAKKCGVNIDNLDVCKAEYAEQSLDILELAVQSGEYALVALDSIAALLPQDEKDNSHSDWQMGLTARLMNKVCRKMYTAIGDAKKKGKIVTVIFINQLRDKIGVMWGSPETTTGGRGMKFAASIRLDLRKGEMLETPDKSIYGQTTSYFFSKNKTASPLKRGTFVLILDGTEKAQVQDTRTLISIGLKLGTILKTGSWYSGEWVGKSIQGEENLGNLFKTYPKEVLNSFLETAEKELFDGSQICFRFK